MITKRQREQLLKNREQAHAYLEQLSFGSPRLEMLFDVNEMLVRGTEDEGSCGQFRTSDLRPMSIRGTTHRPPEGVKVPQIANAWLTMLESRLDRFGVQRVEDLTAVHRRDQSFLEDALPFLAELHYGIYLGQIFPNGNKRTAAMMVNFYLYHLFPDFLPLARSGAADVGLDENASEPMLSYTYRVFVGRDLSPFCQFIYGKVRAAFDEPPLGGFATFDFKPSPGFFDLVAAR